MAGVLSKFDKYFHNNRKSFFEETIFTNEYDALLFTKKDSCLQSSVDTNSDVTSLNSNTYGFRLRNHAKRNSPTIYRNMVVSEDTRSETDDLERNGIHSSDNRITLSDDERTTSGDVRTTSDDVITYSDGDRTSSDNVRTSSGDARTSSDDVRTSSDGLLRHPSDDTIPSSSGARTSSGCARTTSDEVRTSSDDIVSNGVERTSNNDVRTSSDGVLRPSNDDTIPSTGGARTTSDDVRTSSDAVLRPSSDDTRPSSGDARASSDSIRTEGNSSTVQTDYVDSSLDTVSEPNRHQNETVNNNRGGDSRTTQPRDSLVDQLGIVLLNPKYRQYSTPDSRLKSYENWPKENNVNVTQLIDAGFAYTGTGDSVRCFYCGGAFKNWEESSNPWREHALYFPNCGHVRQCKGIAYIKHVCGEEESDFEIDGDEDLVIDRVKVAMKRNKGAIMAARDFCTDENLLRDGIKRILQGKETFSGVELIKATEEIKEEIERRKELAKTTEVECLEDDDSDESDSDSSYELELVEENRKLKDPVMCKICFDKIATIIVLPCGHMSTCSQCISALTHCAICRTKIKGTVRALMAV